MKLAQLIKKLEKMQAKHGNVDVMVDVDSYHCEIDEADRYFDKIEDEVKSNRVVIYLGRTEGIDY